VASAALFLSRYFDIGSGQLGRRGTTQMSAVQSALLLCSLIVAVALTLAWDSFLSYEFFRFAEFIF
jgi:hypothetical protein